MYLLLQSIAVVDLEQVGAVVTDGEGVVSNLLDGPQSLIVVRSYHISSVIHSDVGARELHGDDSMVLDQEMSVLAETWLIPRIGGC